MFCFIITSRYDYSKAYSHPCDEDYETLHRSTIFHGDFLSTLPQSYKVSSLSLPLFCKFVLDNFREKQPLTVHINTYNARHSMSAKIFLSYDPVQKYYTCITEWFIVCMFTFVILVTVISFVVHIQSRRKGCSSGTAGKCTRDCPHFALSNVHVLL